MSTNGVRHRERKNQRTDDPNLVAAADALYTPPLEPEPDPTPSPDARTNAEPVFRLLVPSPSNSSKNSAYALAAFSSSSFFLASAASRSFSRRDFFAVPCVYCDSFWSSTGFC